MGTSKLCPICNRRCPAGYVTCGNSLCQEATTAQTLARAGRSKSVRTWAATRARECTDRRWAQVDRGEG